MPATLKEPRRLVHKRIHDAFESTLEHATSCVARQAQGATKLRQYFLYGQVLCAGDMYPYCKFPVPPLGVDRDRDRLAGDGHTGASPAGDIRINDSKAEVTEHGERRHRRGQQPLALIVV